MVKYVMEKEKKRRYSTSTVKHRRNFPRTLNRFSEQWKKIDVTYKEESATFNCYNEESKVFGQDGTNKVYNKDIALIKLITQLSHIKPNSF